MRAHAQPSHVSDAVSRQHDTPELRALRTIAEHPLGDTPTGLLVSAHSMQAIAIAALDRAGALAKPAPRFTFREPSVRLDHEFGDYAPDHDESFFVDVRRFRRSSDAHKLSPPQANPSGAQAPEALPPRGSLSVLMLASAFRAILPRRRLRAGS